MHVLLFEFLLLEKYLVEAREEGEKREDDAPFSVLMSKQQQKPQWKTTAQKGRKE